MSSQLSAIPQSPLGAVPASVSGRFDAVPFAPIRELPPEDKLARVIGAGLAVFLASAGGALLYLTAIL
jgi:hypothetical protein